MLSSLQQTLVFGASWHVIAAKWWESWCAYTGFSADAGKSIDPSRGARPGGIDNSSLLDESFIEQKLTVIRKNVQENDDYTLVPERAAALLESWYQGPGPILTRRVIHVGVRKVISEHQIRSTLQLNTKKQRNVCSHLF